MKIITRNIWIISMVSMFTDVASEMLYPVMPIYLKSIGFSVVLIGILEGFAEAIAGLSKGYRKTSAICAPGIRIKCNIKTNDGN